MTVLFFDLQEPSNPMNGLRISNKKGLDDILEKLRSREPFFCKLDGENGYKLDVGLGEELGCIQHSPSDGYIPYLMAVAPGPPDVVAPGTEDADDYVEFLAGNTPTLYRNAIACLASK
jgi:hypothetical protein